MAALSVKTSITKFENTENSCAKMKLYFKKSFKRIKFSLIQWKLVQKLSLGAAAIHRLPTVSKLWSLVAIFVTQTVILTYMFGMN